MGFLLSVFLLASVTGVSGGAETPAPPVDPAAPGRVEVSLGEVVLGMTTDRTVYSPGEAVLVDLGIGNTSEKEVAVNTVQTVVGGSEGPMPTAGIKWLPAEVRILGLKGREVWDSTTYTSKERAITERVLPGGSLSWFTYLWPQFGPKGKVVSAGDYAVEAQFLLSRKSWEGGFPRLNLPVSIASQSIHPFYQVEKEGLTWRVDVDRAEFQPGQAVHLKLVVANVGKEPVTILWPQQFLDSYFVICDSGGKQVWTNKLSEEQRGFAPLWPTPVTFPPGDCRLVARGGWDGMIETVAEDTGEKRRVNAPPGEYTLQTVRGFLSMPIFEDLKFSLVAP